jgi:hypothetical protein
MPLGAGSILVLVLAFLLLAESPAFPQTVRHKLFPKPDVRQTTAQRQPTSSTRRSTNSGSARRDMIFRDLTANNGNCVNLPLDI